MTDTRNDRRAHPLWLEEDAMRHYPDDLLKATYEQTRKSTQQVGWRGLLRARSGHLSPRARSGAAALVVVGVALAVGLYANRPGIGGQATASPPDPVCRHLGGNPTHLPTAATW